MKNVALLSCSGIVFCGSLVLGCGGGNTAPAAPEDAVDETEGDGETSVPVPCLTAWESYLARESNPQPWDTISAPISGEFTSFSSPRLIDVDEDGCEDFVFGAGIEDLVFERPDGVYGSAVALSGVDGETLWAAPAPGEIVSSVTRVSREAGGDLLVFGGRNGTLLAIESRSGEVEWAVNTAAFGEELPVLNFYTPLLIDDVNDDGVDDLFAIYGGDPTVAPGDPRVASKVALISGIDGAVIVHRDTPDGAESYTSPVRLVSPSGGGERYLFGTGGETLPGSLWSTSVDALRQVDEEAWAERLSISGDTKGLIAPSVVVDLNDDGIDDIVTAFFGGRVLALEGPDFETLWDVSFSGEETNQIPGVVKNREGEVFIALAHSTGVFPDYSALSNRILDGATGEVLFAETLNDFQFAASPITVDFDRDGVEEVLFTSTALLSESVGTEFRIINLAGELVDSHAFADKTIATPLLFAAEGHQRAEVAILSFEGDITGQSPSPLTWTFRRLNLGEDASPESGWFQYLGPCGDGRYDCD